MDTSSLTHPPATTVSGNSASSAANKMIYSAPASPTTSNTAASAPGAEFSSPVSGASMSSIRTSAAAFTSPSTSLFGTPTFSILSTPKKNFLDAVTLQTIREKLKTPGGACELHTLRLESVSEPLNVLKDRYLIRSMPPRMPANLLIKTPASYRHLIDLTSSNLKCTDVFTEQEFLCKIINEPLQKVQCAYFRLQQDAEGLRSSLYGHTLIRGVHDIVPLSPQRTYVIIAPLAKQDGDLVYEDLHTYIRNRRRLSEREARALFHQISETVRVCHNNGIILRDLKLKRFFFIDEERTKLQYESLEGSMILDDPADDTLSDKIGCPLYTAPELLCPKPTYRGKPADMWSLGVILYTMLVGQYPFYEKGNCNLITIIRHSHVQIPGALSKPVRWLLLGLLRKNYLDRAEIGDIFYSSWLKSQRPDYMNVRVSDLAPAMQEWASATKQLDEKDDAACVEEPLDYTHTTLQLAYSHERTTDDEAATEMC